MPQRFLRPGLTNSERYNSVSFPAESLFVRLLTVVDDYGRCDGRPAVILTQCFTIWNVLHVEPERVTLHQVTQMLQELAAKGLIEIYLDAPERKTVLQVQQWVERVRPGVKERWPAKREDSRVLFTAGDEKLQQVEQKLQQNLGELQQVEQKLQQNSGDLQQNPANLQEIAGSCRNLQASSPSPSPSPSSPPAVPQGGQPAETSVKSSRSAQKLQQVAQKLQQNPASELITSPAEAKRLICELILGGRNPSRLWSPDAESRLEKLCRPPGMPRAEIERIAWFRRLPPSEEIRELADRRVVTETGLVLYWGDEYERAEAYWRKVKGFRANGQVGQKKKMPWPARFKEWLAWKYEDQTVVPERYELIPDFVRDEWDREHEEWEAAHPPRATVEAAP